MWIQQSVDKAVEGECAKTGIDRRNERTISKVDRTREKTGKLNARIYDRHWTLDCGLNVPRIEWTACRVKTRLGSHHAANDAAGTCPRSLQRNGAGSRVGHGFIHSQCATAGNDDIATRGTHADRCADA